MRKLRDCLRGLFALAMVFGALSAPQCEDRPGTIDEIILVDKSLSMANSFGSVKKLVATELIGSVLVPGDRLIIETFYGKIERLYEGTIRSEADKAEAVRRLQTVVANGHFTDIGAVLDRATSDLSELGSPERPKYVVLLTDERQEAPAGSPYVSPDYKLVHPALTYIKRVERGAFSEITVGLDIAGRIEAASATVMKTLSDPPKRSDADFPALPEGTPPGLSAVGTGAGSADGSPAATPGSAAGAQNGSGGAKALFTVLGPLTLPILGILVLAVCAVVALLFIRTRKRDRERHDA